MPRAGATLALTLAVLATALVPSAAPAGTDRPTTPAHPSLEDPIADALAHLASLVDEAGCVHGIGGCSLASTDWTVVAVAAAGLDPTQWPPGGTSPVSYLRAHPDQSSGDLGSEALWRARRLLAVVATGEDPRAFGGVDHVQRLRDSFNAQFGHPGQVNDDVFAILALRAAGVSPSDLMVQGALEHVRRAQHDDGGWDYVVAGTSSTDLTAAALQALAAAGAPRDDPAVRKGVAFLRDHVLDGTEAGCFPHRDGDANVASTAWVTLALERLRLDPRHADWSSGGRGPLDCLVEAQETSGRVGHLVQTTAHAVMALTGAPWGTATTSAPDATVHVRGQAQEDRSVTLEVPGAAHASIWVQGHGLLEGTPVTFTPTRDGVHMVEALAWNEAGRASTSLHQLDVAAASRSAETTQQVPPTVSLSAPATVHRGSRLTANLSVQTGDAPVEAVQVDWGDGNVSSWTTERMLTHTYDTLGNHTLTAWARDDEGTRSAPATATVLVLDAPPVIQVTGPTQVNRTEPFTLSANASDPDGPIPNVTWTMGAAVRHGTHATLTVGPPGAHVVQAVATDAAGNTATAQWTVTAPNRAPVLERVGPLQVTANASHTLRARASDPDGDALTYHWTLDGNAYAGAEVTIEAGGPAHHALEVNVTDPHGGWALAELTLQVVADEGAAQQDPEPRLEGNTTRRSQPNATPEDAPGGPAPPTVAVPQRVQGRPGELTVVSLTATAPDDRVDNLQVRLEGTPVQVIGTTDARAFVPPRPNGTYDLQARAHGTGGWGPWANATLEVVPDEPLTPLAEATPNGSAGDEPAATPGPGPWLLLALAGAALGRRRS